MRLTVTSHLTLDGVVQSNGKAEPELNDGFEQGGWQVPYLDEDSPGSSRTGSPQPTRSYSGAGPTSCSQGIGRRSLTRTTPSHPG